MKSKDLSFTIKGGHIKTKIDDIHHHNSVLNSGCGVHKVKKGKGSYTRKAKHKTNEF